MSGRDTVECLALPRDITIEGCQTSDADYRGVHGPREE